MAGPFRENIKKLVDRLDGGVAGVLMGFDGISVDTLRASSGYDGALPDIQTLSMEFAHLIAQARRTLAVAGRGRPGRVHASCRDVDAGRARADAGVLPRVRHLADPQLRQDPVLDANRRARRCARTSERTRSPMGRKDSRQQGQKCKAAEGRRRRQAGAARKRKAASTSRRFASWRASPPSSTWRRSRSTAAVTSACAAAAAARRGGARAGAGPRPIALTPPPVDRRRPRAIVHQLAVRRHLLPRAVPRGAVLRRRRPERCARARCVCIVEAMKLMNEIEAEAEGTSPRSSSRTASTSSTASTCSACPSPTRVQKGSDRQPRRDRAAGHPRVPRDGDRDRRGALDRRHATPCTSASPTRRSASARRRRARATCRSRRSSAPPRSRAPTPSTPATASWRRTPTSPRWCRSAGCTGSARSPR